MSRPVQRPASNSESRKREERQSAEIDAALAEQREQIARAIEAERNREWQEHLRLHPLADGKSCPRDYGMHDAYYRAARIARETRVLPAGQDSAS